MCTGEAIRQARREERCRSIGRASQRSGRPPARNPKGRGLLRREFVAGLARSSGYALHTPLLLPTRNASGAGTSIWEDHALNRSTAAHATFLKSSGNSLQNWGFLLLCGKLFTAPGRNAAVNASRASLAGPVMNWHTLKITLLNQIYSLRLGEALPASLGSKSLFSWGLTRIRGIFNRVIHSWGNKAA